MARTSETIGLTSRLRLCGRASLCVAALVAVTACKPIARGGGDGGSAGSGGDSAAGGGGSSGDAGGGGSSGDVGGGGSSGDAGGGGSSGDVGGGGSSGDAGGGGSSGNAGGGGSSGNAGGGGSSGDAGGGGSSGNAGGGGSSGNAGGGGSSGNAGGGGSSGNAGGGGSSGDAGGGGFAGAGGDSSGSGGSGGESSSTGSGGSPATCVPGSIVACYSGPAGTRDVGTCVAGTQTCRPDGFGYGPCTGEITPAAENCATPEDESCDGDPSCPQPAAWARGFGGSGTDNGLSIASDAAGNYYVTGSFQGTVDFGAGPLTSAGKEDVFLLKLDPTGTLLWSKRFGTSHTEIGGAVTVDGNGDVLLAGRYDDGYTGEPTGLDFGGCSLPGPLNYYGMFVVKLDNDGNHIWSRSIENDSGLPTHFTVQEMAVDALGNAYIAYDVNETTRVTKLGTAGDTLWTRSMIGYISRDISLALDSAGNAIVVHSALYPDEFHNGLYISKLSPSGDLLWRYQSPGDTWSWRARSVAVTSADEILAVSIDYDTLSHILIKLDADGEHVFNRPVPGARIAVDPADNLLVAGGGLTLLDAEGTELWSVAFAAGVTDIAIAPSGAVAVTGSVSGAVDFGTGPIAYAGGSDIYVATFNPPASGGGSGGTGGSGGAGGGGAGGGDPAETCVPGSVIACYSGPAGTRGVGSCAAGTQTCRPDGFGYGPCTGEVTPVDEACFTPEDESCDGEPSCPVLPPWAHGYGGTGADEGLLIENDAAGNYYVAGTFTGTVDFGAGPLTSTPPSRDSFLIKLDPSGALLWSKRFEDRPFAMTVGESGDIWLAGAYGGGPPAMGFDQCLPLFDPNAAQRAVFVVKLDHDGHPLWRQGPIMAPGTMGLDSFVPEQIAIDALGNAYLAYVNEVDLPDAFMAKLSPAGNVLWNQPIPTHPSGVFYPRYDADLAIDSAGNVLTVTAPESGVGYLAVTKHAPTGAVIWTQQFDPDPSIPPGGDPGDAGWSVAVDAADEVLVAGTTDGTVDLGGGVLPAGPVLLKLDAAGAYVFSDSVPFGDSVAVDGAGNIVVAGSGLAALDASGAELWALSFAADTKDMTIAPNGTIALTGAASSAVDFGTGPIPYAAGSDVFVATFAP
ncbi:hypothetical protein [Sorangium sp. So ce1024]|uniref:hypothetical protein n=1 Tax=Sorangium sp. So ce1024 TaxID=3133327 RepID=UPI003F048F07